MAGHNEKRRMLDDEMSRFEAEISGPNGLDSPHSRMDMRPIIGSNTFAQVKQQLKQASDDNTLQPPPIPPSFGGGNRPLIRPQPGPFNMPHPDDHHREGPIMGPKDGRPSGPGPFGPRQGNFNQSLFRPPINNRPGPPNQGPQGPPFNQNMGPGGGPGPSAFPPPPPPPGFLNNHGGGNFPQNGMGPMQPPGFIPPQVNRSNMNMGPMMNNNGNHMGPPIGPRPPANLLRPPPPPPGLVGQRAPGPMGLQKGMSGVTISKGPTVISSAPKLYNAQDTKDKIDGEEMKSSASASADKKSTSEPKKKKVKSEKIKMEKKKAETAAATAASAAAAASLALEMAEKVKQSMTTVKQAVHSVPHQPHQPHHDEKRRERKPKRNLRYAGGQVWEDPCLAEWDPDDFRMFVGDLGNDVTDELLHRYFSHYVSFVKAKVVRDKRTNKSKGYGFISFKDSQDYIRAMKEMNGKYLGSRPIKLRKSMWKDRNLDIVQKKLKEKQLSGLK